MRHEVGIMQGRLSPPVDGRLQCFPVDQWEDELVRAAELGFDGVEWVFETDNLEKNPMGTPEGARKIAQAVTEAGCRVLSVCANYFIQHQLTGDDAKQVAEHEDTLTALIHCCGELGVGSIILPILEDAAIHTGEEASELCDTLSRVLSSTAASGVQVLLETSLPATESVNLAAQLGDPRLGFVFDTGNCAANGGAPAKEITTYGSLLRHVHIKDWGPRSGNVQLGMGVVDFDLIFSTLKSVGYRHGFILETTRGNDCVAVAREHLAFLRQQLDGM